MKILVTGGAGYIGSHTCVQLLEHGMDVVVIDNLANSSEESLKRVQEISGRPLEFHKIDLLERAWLEALFRDHQFDAVIHFAGLKAVGESVQIPLSYYRNNISGTINLCETMANHNVKTIVFSSSATVYGEPEQVPITEEFPTAAYNPYGRTKLFIEEILKDLYNSDNAWNIVLLRYFNPVGAHKSGKIGEDPKGLPNNLMPFISQVAVGKLKELSVFGNDYSTPDGTGVRDYIHVVDLAIGHVKSLDKLLGKTGVHTYNLGTGRGYSVLEMIKAFEKVSGQRINFNIVDRRPGDIAECFADSTKALKELDWKTERDIDEMCADTWRWQSQNPDGYQ
ncbi:MAG: UDP-glucose 4-epimerase GalE [Candidatus Marinimicrobia bacterium]|nr:UDP-glucose 4-epimerase GalE [Candidatus Neomarinimicrobiota bacterium]